MLEFNNDYKIVEVEYYLNRANPKTLITMEFIVPSSMILNDFTVKEMLEHWESCKMYKLKSWKGKIGITYSPK